MPFHLEKGVIGLRMDYLTRSPAVRAHVLQRLQQQQDPFVVATNIDIPNVGVINVFTDRMADFIAKLDLLVQVDPTPHDPYGRRSGQEYWRDQRELRKANNDSTGNRDSFTRYWLDPQRRAAVTNQLRDALINALSSDMHHIDYWWECSLHDGEPPQVRIMETQGSLHVLFMTDHGPVEPMDTPTRGPVDPDPPGFAD
jgi:hypothetical protein